MNTTQLSNLPNVAPSQLNEHGFLPAVNQGITVKEILHFLSEKPIDFIRIPFDANITTFCFGYREEGAIEAIVLRKNGVSTIVLTNHRELQLKTLNELMSYKPFRITISL